MIWPSDGRVLDAMSSVDLLTCLNGHLNMRNQHVVLRELHLRGAHDVPLARAPLAAGLARGEVEAAAHADDRLLLLAHGELLQVVVRLEQDLAHTGALQPLRLEVLQLHLLAQLWQCTGLHHRVQREGRLAAFSVAHLEGQREVLEVNGAGRVHGGQNADVGALDAFLQHQAAHAPRRGGQGELLRWANIQWDLLRTPANAVGVPAGLLLGRLLLLQLLLLPPQIALHALSHALCVHWVPVLVRVQGGPHRQAALRAQ
mmetsp:Transcript_49390/g.118828  ORF Transcript_49390/g.118828 Transcript_49390/m.118828 type:complete len:258 (+) Transcript_49390:1762-2535(+)